MLSAQFIQAIADAEVRHVSIPNVRTMGELLDPRTDQAMPDVDPDARRRARGEFLDHIAHLPDMLLANIYAPDRTVIWSSNPALTGKSIESDEDLEQAFEYKMQVSASYHDFEDARSEQKFVTPPQQLFIENYIPLFDADGERVTAMVEIYKEPHDLIVRIEHGLLLIWLAIAIGASLVYFGLYGIMRRAARVMAVQQKRLISNETYVALGEMSSAVAHSLRNPLASIRSSAELAQAFDEGPAQKNISDIISQVDRMSQWVRQLLQSLRPLNDDAVPVDLSQVLQESLQAFAVPLARSGVNRRKAAALSAGGGPSGVAGADLQQLDRQCAGIHGEGWPVAGGSGAPGSTQPDLAPVGHRAGYERPAATHGFSAVLHHQTGRFGGWPGAGQADHGTLRRLGSVEQPRRARYQRFAEFSLGQIMMFYVAIASYLPDLIRKLT